MEHKFKTYKEATEFSLTIKWKIGCCTSGEKCWCRIILPDEDIIYDDNEYFYIAGMGVLQKEIAEYIVELHNKNINK